MENDVHGLQTLRIALEKRNWPRNHAILAVILDLARAEHNGNAATRGELGGRRGEANRAGTSDQEATQRAARVQSRSHPDLPDVIADRPGVIEGETGFVTPRSTRRTGAETISAPVLECARVHACVSSPRCHSTPRSPAGRPAFPGW